MRLLAEQDKYESLPNMFGHDARIHRLPLRRDDFVEHGFTEQCAGCQAKSACDVLPRTLRGVPADDVEGYRPDLHRAQAREATGGEGEPDARA